MADNRWAPTPSAAPAHRRMPWRNSPRSRPPPAGFIHPARPTLVANPPTGPGWWHEVKHDGFRTIARKQGDRVDVWSRHGAEFTDRFPNIAEAIRSLPVGRVLIDGEAVAFHSDGHSDFAALRTKTGGEQPHLSPSTFSALKATISASVLWRSGERRSRNWSQEPTTSGSA
jgi:bifunctional non-homologous end joining protein LigD